VATEGEALSAEHALPTPVDVPRGCVDARWAASFSASVLSGTEGWSLSEFELLLCDFYAVIGRAHKAGAAGAGPSSGKAVESPHGDLAARLMATYTGWLRRFEAARFEARGAE
jgi:hypothetical protein